MKLSLIILAGLAVASCTQAPLTENTEGYILHEAWDQPNAPEVFGDLTSLSYETLSDASFASGRLAERPWSDDYWPLATAGLAKRWLLPSEAVTIDAQAPDYAAEVAAELKRFLTVSESADESTRWQLSPAEKYDLLTVGDSFPFARSELASYAQNLRYYEDAGIPWGWMGHCHGWAAAALLVPTPQSAVLAQASSGQEVLFTSGDIRGLLTKAFAENAKSGREYFLGTRCNRSPEELVTDESGRIHDGLLGDWGEGVSPRPVQILYNNWRLAGQTELGTDEIVVVFRYVDQPGQDVHWLRALSWHDRAKGLVNVEVRPLTDGILDLSAPAETAVFRYQKSCRDLNAGAFHLVLAQMLSEDAAATGDTAGFVIEVTRTDEVWNQPVFGYETKLGELTDLENLPSDAPVDPFAGFRTPGTRYLVHAYTTLTYSVENGPRISYALEDEALYQKTYQYTLELDGAGYVIGGEWHPGAWEDLSDLTPLAGAELMEFLGSQASVATPSDAPDFIWRYEAGTKVTASCSEAVCLDPEVLYRLAECSRETPTPGNAVSFVGQDVPYVECPMSGDR